jgi:hypothetical protein
MKLRLIIGLVLLFSAVVAAQTFRGGIQGTVTDQTGAALAGAQVTVTNVDTGFTRTATCDAQGNFTATELPLGNYSVTASQTGFGSKKLDGIKVEISTNKRVEIQLSPGSVKETVQVTADVPMVETSGNTMGGVIEASTVAELPVNGRDFTKLLEIVPGANSDPVGSTESAGSYGLFSVNGNRGRSNNYLLDGTDMNDGYRNLPSINQAGVWGCPGTILPTDALAEVPVTANPDAEFGRSSGATVNLVTKSGTNQIHGDFFEYFRNDALGARNYFDSTNPVTSQQLPKDLFHNNQFGGSMGGPIIKDKSFWFVSYEGQREKGGLPQEGVEPTQSYINNWELSNTINPVIASVLARKPWGTLPVLSDPTIDFAPVLYSTPFVNNSDNVIVKFDQHLHLFSDSDLFTGRYFYSHGTQDFPLGMLNTGDTPPGYDTLTPTHVNIVSLSYTSVPKSNLVVEVRAGFNRFLQDFFPQDINFNPESIGLDTLPPGYDPARDFGMPNITINNGSNPTFSPIGATSSVARGRIDTNYQLFGNVSLTRGTHNFKWGYEYRRTSINSFIDSSHRGSLSFDSLDDFLSGTIDGGGSAAGEGTRYSYQNAMGTYFQDAWRLTPHLTMNYGIRWDYFGVIGEKNSAFSLFDPTTQSLQQVGAPGGPSQLYPNDYKDFAPRLSFVWDALGNGKMVVRAGYGIFYDGPSQDYFVGNTCDYNLPCALAGPGFNNVQFGSLATNAAGASIITAGQPVYDKSSYSSGNCESSGLPCAFTVAPNLVTPRYQSYNLNIESQLARNLAVQVGYIGSQGRHLFHFVDINQVDPSCAWHPASSCQPISASNPDGWVPYSNFLYINQEQSSASSSYNSLQTTMKLRDWHGFTSTLNYTWAHSIDNASDGMDFVPNASQPDNSYNPAGDRASSNFDVRHRVQWYWTYNLPKAQTLRWLTGGWALDGVFNFATGQPYTLSYLFENNYNGSGEYFGRPDIIGNPYAGIQGNELLNLSAFAAPCTVDARGNCIPGTEHFGNEGRNQFNAPDYTNFDLSLSKTSHLTEKLTMELRADFFNVLNHPNFTNPLLPGFGIDFLSLNGAVNNGNGKLTGTGFLSPTATPDVGSGNPYLGGGGPRTIQLAARFSF